MRIRQYSFCFCFIIIDSICYGAYTYTFACSFIVIVRAHILSLVGRKMCLFSSSSLSCGVCHNVRRYIHPSVVSVSVKPTTRQQPKSQRCFCLRSLSLSSLSSSLTIIIHEIFTSSSSTIIVIVFDDAFFFLFFSFFHFPYHFNLYY